MLQVLMKDKNKCFYTIKQTGNLSFWHTSSFKDVWMHTDNGYRQKINEKYFFMCKLSLATFKIVDTI